MLSQDKLKQNNTQVDTQQSKILFLTLKKIFEEPESFGDVSLCFLPANLSISELKILHH